jgi:hypothetical protein
VSRKTARLTISENNRDQGKTFLITEPSATDAERWAMRALLGLGKGGVELPPEVLQLGAAGILYAAGSQALRMPTRLALRLSDEVMSWAQIVEKKVTRALVDEDIEEVTTRLKLKAEALKLTFGFFVPAAPQSSDQSASG